MILHLLTIRSAQPPGTFSWEGQTLTVSGQAFDFSALPPGKRINALYIDGPFVGDTERHEDGVLEIRALWRVPLDTPLTGQEFTILVEQEGPITLPEVKP